jgi:mitochondrial fission protein ELM1
MIVREKETQLATKRPLVWLLMGNRAGDNNQLLALAEALDWPFVEKHIDYNQLRRLPALRRGLIIVARQSRAILKPPWPDLAIGVGYGSVPVARYIREQGGDVKLVHVGNPRDRLDDFDLQITTPQYAREPAPNLLELAFPIGNPARAAKPSLEELDWLRAYPRPRRLIAVGGPARFWELDEEALANAVRAIRHKEPAGSLIMVTSNRTTSSISQLLRELAAEPHEAVVEAFPTFATLLAECDEVYVTADSVSMLSEAILSGKPAGMIPIRRSFKGRLAERFWEKPRGKAAYPDFANFWSLLRQRGLIGTVELPVASQVCDTVERAADQVRDLLAGEAVDEGRIERANPHLGSARRPSRRQQPGDRTRRGHGAPIRGQAARI